MIRRHAEAWKEDADGGNSEAYDDLFRAGIVLSVAAMDAYFTDRFCEALIQYIKKNGLNPKLEKLIQDAGFDTETAIKLFENKRPKRVLSNMVRRHLLTFVTQNFKKVDSLYLCLGFEKPITVSARKKTKRKNLLRSLQILIERRHKIVHSGDYNQFRQLNEVNYRRLIRRMMLLGKFIYACEDVLYDNKI